VEGWAIDSCKNFFGQMIVSDPRAFESTLKMHIFDDNNNNSYTPVDDEECTWIYERSYI